MPRWEIGIRVNQRHVLFGQVGQGGLCVVHRGVDTLTGRPVAVKLPAAEFTAAAAAHRQLQREARVATLLRSPSVPRVYDHGETDLPGGRRTAFVAMELLRGVPLAERLTGAGLPWPVALRTAATAADVLAAAHRNDVVHGDLTPRNIMLTALGPKIIDFGAAVSPAEALACGWPPPDPADDMYALGVLLHQMLTGRSPYPGASATIPPGRPAPAPVLGVPDLPRPAAELCRALMDKRPTGRPDAVSAALALWALAPPDDRYRTGLPAAA